jgi:hypothetical protein
MKVSSMVECPENLIHRYVLELNDSRAVVPRSFEVAQLAEKECPV